MSNLSYTIEEISFSLKTRTESLSQGQSGYKRVTYLQAHVTYFYLGYSATTDYGTVVADLGDVCKVTFDADGNATAIEEFEQPTREAVMSEVTSAIETSLRSVELLEYERSFTKSYLSQISEGYEDNGKIVPWESRFAPQGPSYTELGDWNTGIGSVGYNQLPEEG